MITNPETLDTIMEDIYYYKTEIYNTFNKYKTLINCLESRKNICLYIVENLDTVDEKRNLFSQLEYDIKNKISKFKNLFENNYKNVKTSFDNMIKHPLESPQEILELLETFKNVYMEMNALFVNFKIVFDELFDISKEIYKNNVYKICNEPGRFETKY